MNPLGIEQYNEQTKRWELLFPDENITGRHLKHIENVQEKYGYLPASIEGWPSGIFPITALQVWDESLRGPHGRQGNLRRLISTEATVPPGWKHVKYQNPGFQETNAHRFLEGIRPGVRYPRRMDDIISRLGDIREPFPTGGYKFNRTRKSRTKTRKRRSRRSRRVVRSRRSRRVVRSRRKRV